MRQALRLLLAGGMFVLLNALPAVAQDAPLRVVTTVPDLASLAQSIGGDLVAVTSCAKGTEDPHFVEAKPSFLKDLSQADVFIQVGLELEVGWVPVLLHNARNGKVLPGAPGHIDASTAITPLEVPTGPVDRSMGDVHATGNPHYLLDPLAGLQVARLLQERFSVLRPAHKATFESHYQAFRTRLGTALVGETLARKYDVEKLALLFEHQRLAAFLQSQNDTQALGGWLGQLLPYVGTKAVADHNLWVYFSHRFGLLLQGFLEPKPGVSPTTQHLQALVQSMKTDNIPVMLTAAYYDPRQAQFLSQHTGATTVAMAHQVGSRPGTQEYLGMVDYNVRQLVTALQRGQRR